MSPTESISGACQGVSGEAVKVPKKEPDEAPDPSPDEGAPVAAEGAAHEDLGPAAPSTKQFFLLEYYHEIMKGFAWLRATPKPEESTVRRVQKGFVRWSRGRKSRIGVVAVVAIIAMSYVMFGSQAANTDMLGPGDAPAGGGGGPGANQVTVTVSGTVQQNSVDSNPETLNTTTFASMKVTLKWTDEPASGPLVVNNPDYLGLNITAPNGMSWDSAPVANGLVTWNLDETSVNYGAFNWTFNVVGGDMGDEVPISRRPGPCGRCATDNSNTYTLTIEYSW